jgi:hypothetical protein
MQKSLKFVASVSAADESGALVAATRRVSGIDGGGFVCTGRTAVRSERHGLYYVEIENVGGCVDAAWVQLTSYGMSPSNDLGSVWASEMQEAF